MSQKIAVAHALLAIRPQSPKNQLESDLAFSRHALKKRFSGFFALAIELAEAFQLFDSSLPHMSRRKENEKRSGN